MPALMAAADALVENAGGLTSMEALSVGLPIISFKPIAGHGKENTSEMDEAGVSRLADTPGQLLELLEVVTTPGPTRAAMTAAGRAMFASDPVDHVLETAATARAAEAVPAWSPAGPDGSGPGEPSPVPAPSHRPVPAGPRSRSPASPRPSPPCRCSGPPSRPAWVW